MGAPHICQESNQYTAAGPPSLAGACSDSHLLSLRGGPTESWLGRCGTSGDLLMAGSGLNGEITD